MGRKFLARHGIKVGAVLAGVGFVAAWTSSGEIVDGSPTTALLLGVATFSLFFVAGMCIDYGRSRR